MAFYAKATIYDWKATKTIKNCSCLVCKENIKKGTLRYKRGKYNDICTVCHDELISSPSGTRFIDIKRFKKG